MTLFRRILKHKSAVIQAIVVGVMLSAVFFVFAMFEFRRIDQEERLEVTQRFAVYDNDFNTLIYNNINLLKGFVAYIQTNDILADDHVYNFLDVLMGSQEKLINNIGILKDTTIIWNYPFEANKASIGVDLSKNEMQAPFVNSVKNTGRAVFQGPVNLVQGGRGFIIRYPVIEHDNGYWGQVSIVLKEDAFRSAIMSFEDELSIKSIIIKNEEIIHGDEALLEEDLHWFKFTDDLFVWDVGILLDPAELEQEYFAWGLIIIGFFVFGVTSSAAFATIRANDIVKHESIHDQLTGLRNRNSLDETMTQVFASSNRNHHKAGVLLIDLNKFKEINDTYGHNVGDDVLRETAQRLKDTARTEEILFRVGGDEFLLVVPFIHEEGAMDVISSRLHECLTYRLDAHGNSIVVTASIGYAVYPDDGVDFDTLFQHADRHMYMEKTLKPRG